MKVGILARKKEILASLLLLAVFVLPALSFARQEKEIFVDASSSEGGDGSAARPLRRISDALKKADDDDKVLVAPGRYRENIKIPDGVRVFGADEKTVIIEAKDDDKPVVEMDDDSVLDKVTVRKGKVGIKVKGDESDVLINKCIIEDNDQEGVEIESGSTKSRNDVSITETKIRKNGKSGIFAEKRRVVLIENEIEDNDGNGVTFEAGVSAWIEDNRFKGNDKSGMLAKLDGSSIFTKNNTYRDNGREGLQVDAKGNSGRIDIRKSKFIDNDKFGIARIARSSFRTSVWNGLTVDQDNEFRENDKGAQSDEIQVF